MSQIEVMFSTPGHELWRSGAIVTMALLRAAMTNQAVTLGCWADPYLLGAEAAVVANEILREVQSND